MLVGATIHPLLVGVLLWFRLHHVALIADVSKVYKTIELTESDRDSDVETYTKTLGIEWNNFQLTIADLPHTYTHVSSPYPNTVERLNKI